MTNPNPMNSRCGLEDCDCEYTIGGLLRRLEVIAEESLATVKLTRDAHTDGPVGYVHDPDNCSDDACLCYVAGYEAERRPSGA
jgi:hypothetical protein